MAATRESVLAKLDAYYAPRIQTQLDGLQQRETNIRMLRAEYERKRILINKYFNAAAEAAQAQAKMLEDQAAIDEIEAATP